MNKHTNSTLLVIFGANGDLTSRKLVPALYDLYCCDRIGDNFKILGISRTEYSDQEFRNTLEDKLKSISNKKFKASEWEKFASQINYMSLDVTDSQDYQKLSAKLDELSEDIRPCNFLYYLSTSPNLYQDIIVNMKEANLIAGPEQDLRTDIIVEKPIGHDLDSAIKLDELFKTSLREEQIFRIDHYLGKEAIQNILLFRFANAIFESLWNRKYIDHIQITVAESIGVEARTAYYDKSGALRDMVQNHLMQILALLCIEPPISLTDPRSIRDEKVKVLRAIKRFSCEDVINNAVRAQYTEGMIDGESVAGFKDLPGVAPASQTETFAAMKLEIDNWRWAGVPIYLRTGKRLKKRASEITVFFKRAPESTIKSLDLKDMRPNVLSIELQPDESISVQFNVKPPGLGMQVKPVIMDFEYDETFAEDTIDAYERLLLDVIKGDQTLFIRNDEVIEAWKIMTPILDCWSSDEAPELYTYQAGTWGPRAASELIVGENHWRHFD